MSLEYFLESLVVERNASKHTLEAYRRDLADFETALGAGTAQSLSRKTIEAYLADLIDLGMATSTVARKRSAIKQYLSFLTEEGLRDDNPAAQITSRRPARALPKILSIDEVSTLLAQAKQDAQSGSPEAIRMLALMEVLYASGLRVSELVELPLEAIQDGMEVLIVTGKGNKQRMVPLGRAAQQALGQYLSVRDQFLSGRTIQQAYVFPSSGKEGHLTRQRFGQLLKDLCSAAGIEAKRVSPHVLRHAFATHILHNGADLRVVQTLLGHADVGTTEIYTHVANERLKSLVFDCHPLSHKSET